MTRLASLTCMAILAGMLLPPTASAQVAAPVTTGLEITEVKSGFVAAPEARITTINDRSTTLAGGYAGWLTDGALFLGGAGYWNTNRSRDFAFQTGGALVGWTLFRHSPIALTPAFYAGVGSAELTRPYADLFGPPRGQAMPPNGRMAAPGTPVGANTRVRVRDSFFVAEPRVNGSIGIRPWMRLSIGAGYRFIGDSRWLDNQLKGASGSIALQFGK